MSDPLWINAASDTSVGSATIAASTDLFTITAHGLSTGERIVVSNLTGGASTVLVEGGVYWVRDALTNTFAVTLTKSGAPIDFSADGGADVNLYQPSYTAAELRQAMSGWLQQGRTTGVDPTHSDIFGARMGIMASSADDTALGVSSGSWTTTDFVAAVYPGITSNAGTYLVPMEADSGAIDPADGTNDRIDGLDLQVQDDDEDASGFRRAQLVYVVGTPAPSPVAPAVTANALRLGTLLVPAGGAPSPSATTTAPITVARGGVLPIRGSSERPAANRYAGLVVWDRETEELQVNVDGLAEWGTLASPRGWQRIDNGTGSGTLIDIDLTAGGKFPAGTFDTIRIRATGTVNADGSMIAAQINGQTGANYRRRSTVMDMTATISHAGVTGDSANNWLLAEWDTLARSSLTFELYRCADNIAVPFRAEGIRINGDGFWTSSGGRYNTAIIPSSLQLFPGAPATSIEEFTWELEGYRK